MKIANGVEMLEIAATLMGVDGMIHPSLLWDDETVVLVDSGFPGHLALLQEAIEHAGVPFERLNTLILTHHDIDHLGGAAAVVQELPGKVKVLAHEIEKPYVQGDVTPLKLAQIEANLGALPPEMKSMLEKMTAGFQRSYVSVDQTFADGEVLPLCGGLQVILTPGHTLGHCCLLHLPSKTLIAGDALSAHNGELALSPDTIHFDVPESLRSLEKLAAFDIQNVICYHGGFASGNIRQQIAGLA